MSDLQFGHLLGDIREPVVVIGDDPDAEGNVLVAAFLPAQSVPAANVYDPAVASTTDTVDGAGKTDAIGQTGSTQDGQQPPADQPSEAPTSSPTTDTPPSAPSGDTPAYTDNGDGSWTRTTDGARGHFGPDGFTPSGGETGTVTGQDGVTETGPVTDVSWGT